jgi:Tol biopolymer transport system component
MGKKHIIFLISIVTVSLLLIAGISAAFRFDESKAEIRQLTSKGMNYEPEWSPDGSAIVYVSTERGLSSIWVVDKEGVTRQMISQPESGYEYSTPTWSPDGTQIAFLSSGEDYEQSIYTINANGSNLQKLSGPERGLTVLDLKWSPSGSKIMFSTQSRMTMQNCIWTIAPEEGVVQVTNRDDAYNATWSPDGSRIAYELVAPEREEIWMVNADGSDQKQLLPQVKEYYIEVYRQPTWNADGSKIACAAYSSGFDHFDIIVLDLNDKSVTTLTDRRPRYYQPFMVESGYEHIYYPGLLAEGTERGDEVNPKWSPEGSKILFETENGNDIWVMNSDGTDMFLLVANDNPHEIISNPQWSPDGSEILFERQQAGSRNLYVVTLEEVVSESGATTPSPLPNITISSTPEPTISPELSPTVTPPTANMSPPTTPMVPAASASPAASQEPVPVGTPKEPGFQAICALAGVVAGAYLLRQKNLIR